MNKEEVMLKLVKEIKTARVCNNLSVAKLSEMSGVSVGVISDLENNKGKVPSLTNFIALTRTLNISEEFVLNLVFNTNERQSTLDKYLKSQGIYNTKLVNHVHNTIEFLKTLDN